MLPQTASKPNKPESVVMNNRCLRLAIDRRGVSEVVGMLLSITLTILTFALLVVTVLLFVSSNPIANVVAQGAIYDGGSGIVISHYGGDAVPVSVLYAQVFINETDAYEPGIIPLSSDYSPDDDSAWEMGDKVLLNQSVNAGSTVDIIIVDTRYGNIISNIFINRV